jgi:hypothetical protein
MQVGDLVKHKQGGALGLIVRIEEAEGGHDPLFYVKWANEHQSACWTQEIEIIKKNE